MLNQIIHPCKALDELIALKATLFDLLTDISTCAERTLAFSGKDRASDVGIFIDVFENLTELIQNLIVDCV